MLNRSGGDTFGSPQSSYGVGTRPGTNSKKFTEGNLYKQVVSFQSGRGQMYNDAIILKSSINNVKQRSERNAFIKNRMGGTDMRESSSGIMAQRNGS